jgi:hypothetical protein
VVALNDDEKLEYIIPRRIRQGYEVAPGWGKKQSLVLVAGLVSAVLLFIALHLVSAHLLRLPIFVQLFPPFIVLGSGFLVATPQLDGSTILERIENWQTWSKRQKLYLYDWSKDDF